jgi:hypothetical protein
MRRGGEAWPRAGNNHGKNGGVKVEEDRQLCFLARLDGSMGPTHARAWREPTVQRVRGRTRMFGIVVIARVITSVFLFIRNSIDLLAWCNFMYSAR